MRPYPDVPVGLRITDQELHESNFYQWTKGKVRTLIKLRNSGFTWAEIASEMNISRSLARRKYYKVRRQREDD